MSAVFAVLAGVAAGAISDADLSDLGGLGVTVPSPGDEISPWVLVAKMIGALALVLGLIALAAYLTRRFGVRPGILGRSDVIRIVSTKMLGGR